MSRTQLKALVFKNGAKNNPQESIGAALTEMSELPALDFNVGREAFKAPMFLWRTYKFHFCTTGSPYVVGRCAQEKTDFF